METPLVREKVSIGAGCSTRGGSSPQAEGAVVAFRSSCLHKGEFSAYAAPREIYACSGQKILKAAVLP